MKVYVVTFLYPDAVQYLPDLIDSLANQDSNEFELIVFNDGVENPGKHFKQADFSTDFVKIKAENILGVRIKAFEYLRTLPECKIIFQDADDCLSQNRISLSIELLEEYSLVCNDLRTFWGNEYADEGLWKNRLVNKFKFDHKFLLNQNIVGFGNTAILSSLLNNRFSNSDLNVVPDWYLFYQLMYFSNKVGVFTSNCQTYYRMHESNLIGVKNDVINKIDLKHIINVKEYQYQALQKIGIATEEAMRILEVQKRNLKNYRNKKITAPFWWEQTELLNE